MQAHMCKYLYAGLINSSTELGAWYDGAMNENTEKTPKLIRNERGQLLPGVILNPRGRPKGAWGARKRAFLEIARIIEKAQQEAAPQAPFSDA